MKFNTAIVAACTFLLCSCATTPPPVGYNISSDEQSLAESSFAVSRSMTSLAETEQAAHPIPKVAPPPSPASYGMGATTSVDWSGPVEPLIRQIASAANYRVNILGTRPAIPILITINENHTMLGDILRDIGYQCGKRATIIVFPDLYLIELRYAKN